MIFYTTFILFFVQFGLSRFLISGLPDKNLILCTSNKTFEVKSSKTCQKLSECDVNISVPGIVIDVECDSQEKICCESKPLIADTVMCPGTEVQLNREKKCHSYPHGAENGEGGQCDEQGRHSCFFGHCCPIISIIDEAFITPKNTYYTNITCTDNVFELKIGSYCLHGKLVFLGLRDAAGQIQQAVPKQCKNNGDCGQSLYCVRFYGNKEVGVCAGRPPVTMGPQIEEPEPTTADPLSWWAKTKIFLDKWMWQLIVCAIMCLLGFLAWLALYIKNRLVRHILTSPIDPRDLPMKGWETFGTTISPPKDTEKDCFC